MNLKCTILRYLASLILSTVVIYAIVIVAGMFGADYGFSPGDTFIIWILMAILNQSKCYLEEIIIVMNNEP